MKDPRAGDLNVYLVFWQVVNSFDDSLLKLTSSYIGFILLGMSCTADSITLSLLPKPSIYSQKQPDSSRTFGIHRDSKLL